MNDNRDSKSERPHKNKLSSDTIEKVLSSNTVAFNAETFFHSPV